MRNKKSEIRNKKWFEIPLFLFLLFSLMLNPDWVAEYLLLPFLFGFNLFLIVKIVKREK